MSIVFSPSFSFWSCQHAHWCILSSCLFTWIYCVYHSDYLLRMERVVMAVYIKMYMKVYVCLIDKWSFIVCHLLVFVIIFDVNSAPLGIWSFPCLRNASISNFARLFLYNTTHLAGVAKVFPKLLEIEKLVASNGFHRTCWIVLVYAFV